MINAINKLSSEGFELLNDPFLNRILSSVAASVGVTAEEYLLRFEEVLIENPKAIFDIFEKTKPVKIKE